MKMNLRWLVIAAIFCCAGAAGAQSSPDLESADKLFQSGKFAEAKSAYLQVVKADDKNFQAHLRLGHIALLSNDFKDCDAWLSKAAALQPDNKSVKNLQGESYYRRDDFARAAAQFQEAGREPLAKKLESFAGKIPYQITKKDFEIRVKFLQTDPLPLVSARVNGGEPANFLIDTGGPEIVLGAEFAKQLGVVQFGEQGGQLAGGRASVGNGRIDSFTIGDLEVRNLPVQILEERLFAAGAPDKKVAGVVGTVFLYHFLATMDYTNAELVLRPKSEAGRKAFEKSMAGQKPITVPFWMAGDHFMLAWGTMNDSGPLLWFVDTGLAGRGWIGPAPTLKEAKIEIPAPPTGSTSGGIVSSSAPLVIDRISLGDAVEQKISGLQGQLSSLAGIRFAGIISHQFFKSYSLTLDFERMTMYLKRAPDPKK
ncbi:MAG: aspartyl protease family protein [Acidobacteria bacterium]|nr:aspartyl protease family protein [Acidobacteriota bacterium]